MPYIKQDQRNHLDFHIEEIVKAIRRVSTDISDRPGPTNYVVSRIVLGALKPNMNPWSYHSISRAVSVLNDAKTEMERRLMAKREDKAIASNGDLEEYK
jgi:hypothetical protein